MTKLSDLDAELESAIKNCDLLGIRSAIGKGANPNAEDEYGESMLEDVFNEPSHCKRMAMLQLLVELGAKPGDVSRKSMLSYVASFAKNAEEMALLLEHGLNPNGWTDPPETTYDEIEFDYRYDLWGFDLPFEPNDEDKTTENSWLDFLERCVYATNKVKPDQLRLLRQYGALTYRERESRRTERDKAGILQRIVSGGQTGADRAALDWAIEEGIPYGGWVPEGRATEDGRISERYVLQELSGAGYRERTKQNVIDSDGTLIVNLGELSGGTLMTLRFAEQLNKPCLVIQAKGNLRREHADQLNQWSHSHCIQTLNALMSVLESFACIHQGEAKWELKILCDNLESDPACAFEGREPYIIKLREALSMSGAAGGDLMAQATMYGYAARLSDVSRELWKLYEERQ